VICLFTGGVKEVPGEDTLNGGRENY